MTLLLILIILSSLKSSETGASGRERFPDYLLTPHFNNLE